MNAFSFLQTTGACAVVCSQSARFHGDIRKLGARFKCVQIEDTQQERAQFIIEGDLSFYHVSDHSFQMMPRLFRSSQICDRSLLFSWVSSTFELNSV